MYAFIFVSADMLLTPHLYRTAVRPEDSFKYCYKLNVELLNYLKGIGSLLCTVKPEFLLSESDFGRFVENRIEGMVKKISGTYVEF
jgi:hypothetical protein